MKQQERHLTDSELANIDNAKNSFALLEHIRACPFCSERLAQSLLRNTIPSPHYLKQKILAKKQYQKQKKQEFTVYCVKVCFAVAASLAIIFLSDTTKDFSSQELWQSKTRIAQETASKQTQNISQDIYRKTDIINQKIINFTDSLAHIAP